MSDTREEIAIDAFYEKHKYECVTCKYYYKDICNLHDEDIEAIAECDDWTERNIAQEISEQRRKMYEKLKRKLGHES